MSSPAAPDTDRSARLSDTALSALALREQPFVTHTAGAGDGAAFADDVTAQQLADVRQALITGDDLLLILGEAGAGKSTLLAQLAAHSGLRLQCFSVDGGPRFSTRNLFTGMLEAFKIEPPDELKQTLDELIPCLQAMVGNNKLCVVVLDDAQALAANELTTLLSGMLYINSRDESLLRIALAARPEFEDRIPDLLPEGADLPYSSLSLGPFDPARAAAYLGFRFARAGGVDELPLAPDEIAALNEQAGGRPGPLHLLAATALEDAYGVPGTQAAALGAADDSALGAHEPADAEADLPLELRDHHAAGAGGSFFEARFAKLALGALAGLLIVGGLLLFRDAPEPGETEARYRVVEERKVETARDTEQLRLLQESEAARRDATVAAEAAAEEAAEAARSAERSAGRSAEREVADEAAVALAAEEDAAGVADAPSGSAALGAARESAGSLLPDAGSTAGPTGQEPEETTARATDGPGTDEAGQASSEPDDSAPDTTAATAADGDPIAGEPDEARSGEIVAAEDVTPAAEDELAVLDGDVAPVAPEPATPVNGVLESPNWVLVQDSEQFTVQMSASTERASVEAFLERNDLPAPNSIFTFDRDGRTWYALVHGLYPSIGEARTAIERMPAEAQSNQPWIRAIGRIQDVLREQN